MKIESNASVLVPKGYELVLGEISIKSQNTVKINFYEPVFLNVTEGTFYPHWFSQPHYELYKTG